MEEAYHSITIICAQCGAENSLTGSIEAFEEVDCSQCKTPLGLWLDLVNKSEANAAQSIRQDAASPTKS